MKQPEKDLYRRKGYPAPNIQARPPIFSGKPYMQPHPHSYSHPYEQSNSKKVFGLLDPPTLFHAGSQYDNDRKKGYTLANEDNVNISIKCPLFILILKCLFVIN